MTNDEIGKRVGGRSSASISNIVRLLQLPDYAKHAIAEGVISEGHGRQLLAIGEDAKAQKDLYDRIVKENFTPGISKLQTWFNIANNCKLPQNAEGPDVTRFHEMKQLASIHMHDLNERIEAAKTINEYNKQHNITPHTVASAIKGGIGDLIGREEKKKNSRKLNLAKIPENEWEQLARQLSAQMDMASANLEFELAADLRDQITEIREKQKNREK